MRAVLGRIAAVAVLASSVLAVGNSASAQDAGEGSTDSSTTSSTVTSSTIESSVPAEAPAESSSSSSSSTTTTTTTTTPTTTLPPLLVAELPTQPSRATPERGTQAQVTDTQPPPPTTTTLPPSWVLPANSGEGRRVVYSKSRQRVWTVEANGTVSKTHLVSGRRTWNQPLPGTYSVFSRSTHTCNIKNPNLCWRYMVRFTKGPGGDNIGFHEIPVDRRTGRPVQSVSQLGTALSGGCVRQATPDAVYIWNWAPVGTKVVVLA